MTTYKMDCISDIALDLGVFALDSELECGQEFSQRTQTRFPSKPPRALEIHRQAVRAPGGEARKSQQAEEVFRR